MLTLDNQLEFTIECLEKALAVIMHGDLVDEHQRTMSVEFMQCVAQVRFGLCFAANMFYKYYCNEKEVREKLPRATKELFETLICTVKKVVLKSVLKEPHDFIIKQIVRCYGRPYLITLGDQPEFEWLVSEPFKVCITTCFIYIAGDYIIH